jgi:hypothetical protein
MRRVVVAFVLVLCLPSLAVARTWRVARYGPADFTTIQPALDAASPGDTVRIGDGEYLEYETVTPPGWPVSIDVYGYVHDDSLTILGDHAGAVIVGPRAANFSGYSPVGIFTGQGFSLCVRRLSLRNLYDGMYIGSGNVEVTESSFQGCEGGISSFGRCAVYNCTFLDCAEGVLTFGANGVQIRGSSFYSCSLGVSINNTSTGALVEDCRFTGGGGGVGVTEFSDCVVTNCTISDCGSGLVGNWFASMVAEGNRVSRCVNGVYLLAQCRISGSGNVFDGGDNATLFLLHSYADLHGNHILKGSGWAVRLDGYVTQPEIFVDLTGNYWGTADRDSIEAWIKDGNDDPSIHGFVKFEPFSPVPVPEKKETMGGVKALFRGRR